MGKKAKEDIYSTANFVSLYLYSGYGRISDSTNVEHDYDCLLKWMMSLQANVTHIELNELTSGRAFINALRVIDSNYFNDAWMEVFKDANYEEREWRLRANVLRKILKSVLKYNEEICNNVISKNILPNVMVIARDGSKEEIIKFIRIVVAAAVNGPRRDGMIKNIFDLEKSVQHTLMLTIQGLEFEGDNSGELEVECKSAVMKHLTAERDSYVQEIDKLKHQLSLVCKRNEDSENERQREISELKIQIETLRDSLDESESARDQMATEYDELLRQVQHSQMMKEQRKSHTYKLEAGVYKRQAQSLEQRLEEAVEKSLQLEKEKQLIADRLAVLDQEHDRTLWERNQLSSRVEELRKRLQTDENKTLTKEREQQKKCFDQASEEKCRLQSIIGFFKVIYHLDVAVKMNADDSNYTVADVEAMKARLVQNEATIEDLKEENNRQQIMFEQEERLITTAFYELVTHCLLKNEKMNILPKKRWHVRTKDNVAKVRRDIAQAEVEERQRLARVQLAEQEARTRFLISKVEHLIPKERNNVVTVDQSDASGHVNLFADFEFQESTNFGLNREAEQEKRLLKEKEERRIGLLKYLGEGSSEYTKKLAWWQQVPDRHRTKPANNNDVHSSLDVVDVKRGQVNNNHKRKKKMMLSVDELRRKRLNREREERLKAEKLKRKHENNFHERDGGDVDNQQAESAADDNVKPKYSNQFNPIIAKQNRK
ncbi:Protein Hook -like protein [Trichinella patagoniensis]|uniref:Protein Hook-like protein n=2 Tax=Trichinella patagoniensis TaxID=990121 RepID=A0A0V1AG76_9BILA|nr:Protein Hook -like protein [Trichinella patagoniensis]